MSSTDESAFVLHLSPQVTHTNINNRKLVIPRQGIMKGAVVPTNSLDSRTSGFEGLPKANIIWSMQELNFVITNAPTFHDLRGKYLGRSSRSDEVLIWTIESQIHNHVRVYLFVCRIKERNPGCGSSFKTATVWIYFVNQSIRNWPV